MKSTRHRISVLLYSFIPLLFTAAARANYGAPEVRLVRTPDDGIQPQAATDANLCVSPHEWQPPWQTPQHEPNPLRIEDNSFRQLSSNVPGNGALSNSERAVQENEHPTKSDGRRRLQSAQRLPLRSSRQKA